MVKVRQHYIFYTFLGTGYVRCPVIRVPNKSPTVTAVRSTPCIITSSEHWQINMVDKWSRQEPVGWELGYHQGHCHWSGNKQGFPASVNHQGLYSLSDKTSYRQISWNLEAARLSVIMIVSLWNLTGISAALLPRCLSNFRAIEKV